MNEPWDPEANRRLVAEMPKVYKPDGIGAGEGMTFYCGFAGPGSVFETGKKLPFADITDGVSITVAVVEAGEECIWTKPDNLPFDPSKPLPKLGGQFGGDFHVALCNGEVRLVSRQFDPEAFKKAVTRQGGEAFNSGDAFPPVGR